MIDYFLGLLLGGAIGTVVIYFNGNTEIAELDFRYLNVWISDKNNGLEIYKT